MSVLITIVEHTTNIYGIDTFLQLPKELLYQCIQLDYLKYFIFRIYTNSIPKNNYICNEEIQLVLMSVYK